MTPSRASPHLLAASLCVGLAFANLARGSWPAAVAAGGVGCGAIAASGERRVWVTCAALVLLAWWWGSARLQALDRSVLLGRVDTSERARVVVTAPLAGHGSSSASRARCGGSAGSAFERRCCSSFLLAGRRRKALSSRR